jgi:hypothetical protein
MIVLEYVPGYAPASTFTVRGPEKVNRYEPMPSPGARAAGVDDCEIVHTSVDYLGAPIGYHHGESAPSGPAELQTSRGHVR